MRKRRMKTHAMNASKIIKSRLDVNKISNDNPLMRGIVVDNDDPKKMGRVRIRIPSIHGRKELVKKEDLPWAYPCFPVASYNSGMFILPEVGSRVWLLFEDGDLNKPVYIGGMYSKGAVSNSTNFRYTGDDEKDVRYPVWYKPYKPDEAESIKDKVIYKSPMGASFVVKEDRGQERIEITDQMGQKMIMSAPVDEDVSLLRYEFLDEEAKFKEDPFIELITLNGSSIKLKSGLTNAGLNVTLVGHNPVVLDFDTSKDHLDLVFGELRVQKKDKLEITYKDMEFCLDNGKLIIKADEVEVQSDVIRLGEG